MVIFEFFRALIFDWRKNRAIREARRSAHLYRKKFLVLVYHGRPGLCFHAGREKIDPAKTPPGADCRKSPRNCNFRSNPKNLAPMFLTLDDYRSVCDQYELKQITQDEETRLDAEAAALEQIGSYLRYRYDINRAFTFEGSDRNPMLVQCAVNISLWLMIHRLPQSMGHERRECLYNDSVKWLRDIQAGKASPDLPLYESDGDNDARNPVRFGSMNPNRYDW